MSDPSFRARTGRRFRLGLIVNPLAGIGGAVGLKGSDGAAIVHAAFERGAVCRAGSRCLRALGELATIRDEIEIHCAAGRMGEESARAAGFDPRVLAIGASPETTAADTEAAARALLALPVDLLLFAGGDGTARDVWAAVGSQLAVLGIPAGVKMHSGVYAVSPEAAGDVVARLVAGRLVSLREAEVRDLDEEAFRGGRVLARHVGEMRVPDDQDAVQRVKAAAAASDAADVEEIAAGIADDIDPQCLYVLGPGSTLFAIKRALGFEGTLLGVDIWRGGECIARDAGAPAIRALVAAHAGPVCIVVTPIGGQGHVFGRGNQQIGAELIRRAGVANLRIVASPAKLRALEGRPLLADTDDPALDAQLQRMVSVTIGYRHTVLYPLGAAAPAA